MTQMCDVQSPTSSGIEEVSKLKWDDSIVRFMCQCVTTVLQKKADCFSSFVLYSLINRPVKIKYAKSRREFLYASNIREVVDSPVQKIS